MALLEHTLHSPIVLPTALQTGTIILWQPTGNDFSQYHYKEDNSQYFDTQSRTKWLAAQHWQTSQNTQEKMHSICGIIQQ